MRMLLLRLLVPLVVLLMQQLGPVPENPDHLHRPQNVDLSFPMYRDSTF